MRLADASIISEVVLDHDWICWVLGSLEIVLLIRIAKVGVACAKIYTWRRSASVQLVLVLFIAASASGSGVHVDCASVPSKLASGVTCWWCTEILFLLRDLALLSKVDVSRSIIILRISSTGASIPLCLSLIATGMTSLTSMAQVTITTGRPYLRGCPSLVDLVCLIFHKTNVLKLAEVNISKVFK